MKIFNIDNRPHQNQFFPPDTAKAIDDEIIRPRLDIQMHNLFRSGGDSSYMNETAAIPIGYVCSSHMYEHA